MVVMFAVFECWNLTESLKPTLAIFKGCLESFQADRAQVDSLSERVE